MSPTLGRRKEIAQDTIARSAAITASTPGASLESTFFSEQLPSLDQGKCPGLSTHLKIANIDSFSAARSISKEDPDAEGNIAVLNLASDAERGGGWVYSLSKTQVCLSSTKLDDLKVRKPNNRKRHCAILRLSMRL